MKKNFRELALECEQLIEDIIESENLLEVTLNKPSRNPSGSRKKFSVKVKNPKTGNIKTIQFGDPNMEIRRDNPERLKAFRSRHKCDTAEGKDKMTARYWSCYQWRKNAKVES